MCERERECERESVCEREGVYLTRCMCVRERENVCVCVRERERECVCGGQCVCTRKSLCRRYVSNLLLLTGAWCHDGSPGGE